MIIWVIYKIFIPDHIFKVKSMKFHMEMALGKLVNLSLILSKFRNLDFSKFLQISVWIAFGINGVNMTTQNTLNGLFSNLKHTLVVIVPRVDWLFKVMRLNSKVKVTALGKFMIMVIFILVCLAADTRDISCCKQRHILFYIWDECIYLQLIFIIPCAI